MELLSDPLKDRFLFHLKPPPHKPMPKEILFTGKSTRYLSNTEQNQSHNKLGVEDDNKDNFSLNKFTSDLSQKSNSKNSPNLFTQMPDWKLLMIHLLNEGRLTKEAALCIIRGATEIFQREPNLIRVLDPVIFVGDIHGQFYDLHHILIKMERIGEANYVFMGDYVDRGMFSIEVLLLLYALKINFPKKIILLRGNHECE